MMVKFSKISRHNIYSYTRHNISFISKNKHIQDIPFYHFKIKSKSPYNKWGLYLIAEQKLPMIFNHPIFNMKLTTCFFIGAIILFSTTSAQGILFTFYFILILKMLRISEIRKFNKKTIKKIYLIHNRKNEIAVEFIDSKKLLIMRINYISITNEQIFEQIDFFNNNMPISYLQKTFFVPTNIMVYDRQAFDAVMNGIIPYFDDSELEGKKIKYKKLETNDYLSYKI